MNELNSWEQQARGWTPRKPADRIARRLFGTAVPKPAAWRRMEVWGWLTPVAACALTFLLVVGNVDHRPGLPENKGGLTFFAAEMLMPSSSNVQQTVRLSQLDENVQWNMLSPLTPPGPARHGEAAALREAGRAIPTNSNQ